ncbi:MAG: hypothetical protein UU67_C0027G0006 [Candidatus Daviesbacteria bacterium GW2011_GWB1_41_5]|uniref:Uncharacterized protein n=1 Tax=Candidatus Daviesbacteria bacterium GW2011_GWB1_41_5 TaxID=1618429 RepID=A0A0G0WKH1_9BACT|nr:MAG: hypothetical protein UU67_C0027G0006 [Candidatus Daviesbacteria bacterium GW2011_GWB1_41_5]
MFLLIIISIMGLEVEVKLTDAIIKCVILWVNF